MCGHLTAAGLGGEVVLEALRTPALVHARRVDASGRFFTDAGVQLALVDIWDRPTLAVSAPANSNWNTDSNKN